MAVGDKYAALTQWLQKSLICVSLNMDSRWTMVQ